MTSVLSSDPAWHRRAAARRLTGLVEYVPLRRGSKVPSVRFSDPSSRLKEAPLRRNLGAMPVGRTVIFDIDTKHSSLTPDEQAKQLSRILGFPVAETFTTITPSGGLHLYLLWPEGAELPGNRKLKLIDPAIDGDIRAAGTHGYCVLPGSVAGGAVYEVLRDVPVREVPVSAAGVITGAAEAADRTGGRVVNVRPEDFAANRRAAIARAADPALLHALRRELRRKGGQSYVSRRARVYAAMSCCYGDSDVLAAWVALGLDRDSSRKGRHIQAKALIRELSRLEPAGDHSPLCERLQESRLVVPAGQDPFTAEELSELVSRTVPQLRRSRGYCRPAVLDFPLAVQMIYSGKRGPGRHAALAVSIVEDFIQPWVNAGVSQILLAASHLAAAYGVPEADVRGAKRLLLNRNIIYRSVRQLPGRAAAYRVNEALADEELSRALYALKADKGGSWFVSGRDGVFRDVSGANPPEPVRKWRRSLASPALPLPAAVPLIAGEGAVRYIINP